MEHTLQSLICTSSWKWQFSRMWDYMFSYTKSSIIFIQFWHFCHQHFPYWILESILTIVNVELPVPASKEHLTIKTFAEDGTPYTEIIVFSLNMRS